MNDDFVKNYLHEDLRWVRRSILGAVDGLSEYDIRRPLTRTGTNLLGLIKHLTLSEVIYLGDIFGRPFAGSHPRFDDPGYRNSDSLWVTSDESTADIVNGYQRAWQHADTTITALPLDITAQVPWWPQPTVTLFNVLVHMITETNRHAGHADILREQLTDPAASGAQDEWQHHRTRIEEAARRYARALSPGEFQT